MKAHGIKNNDDKKEERFKVKICPKCDGKNAPIQKFCGRCGSPLDIKTAIETDEEQRTVGNIISSVLDDPDIKEMIIKKAIESGLEKEMKRMLEA